MLFRFNLRLQSFFYASLTWHFWVLRWCGFLHVDIALGRGVRHWIWLGGEISVSHVCKQIRKEFSSFVRELIDIPWASPRKRDWETPALIRLTDWERRSVCTHKNSPSPSPDCRAGSIILVLSSQQRGIRLCIFLENERPLSREAELKAAK